MAKQLTSSVPLPEFPFEITHQDEIYSLGSCFSEHIGSLLKNLWFPIQVNPFGTLFNPLSILHILERSFQLDLFTEESIQEHNGLYFLWETHGRISDTQPAKVLERANQELTALHNFLQKGNYMLITFGTSFYFEHHSLGKIVANCHKQPQDWFTRKRANSSEIALKYLAFTEKVQKLNPHLKFIFTVSPVRHARDGFVANNRSKAELLLAIEQIEAQPNNFYFPSYEIQMDELRDYRFYADDLLHPSPLAIELIFEKFKQSILGIATTNFIEEISKINAQEAHRPMFPELPETKHAEEKLKEKKAQLQGKIWG
ncbi:MAG: GSCFA domain-containing protein [Crocinitomicaceae bacterium]